MLNLSQIRNDFPILHQQIQGKPLIYFDNAATSQKPQAVIDVLNNYYQKINSNVHRGVHTLAERSTTAFEATREAVRKFVNAKTIEEIIYTKGTTEGINLVASSYGKKFLTKGDEIIISTMEHHSNIVPWQMLCEEKDLVLKVIPINDDGDLIWEEFEKLLSPKTKIVAVTHVSNALGTINPVKKITELAHQVGAVVLLDGAQASPHFEIDVQDLDCDFYVFSGHKIYAPTGIGILYGKKAILEQMPPYLGGGEMIKEVTFEKTTYNDLPFKFEAGTPNIADVVALKTAIDYIHSVGKTNIAQHEHNLLTFATDSLKTIKGLKIIGQAKNKASVISFIVDGAHHMDIGMMLDANGIAVRTGNHCTMPLMKRFGITGTARASFAMYNSIEEVEFFVKKLDEIVQQIR
ncbi:MAG: cysteine desulfurase [Bacteroidetes bacterium]|nr:MAG: cysteine desulfurase [Bacteroidota bacterium]